MKNKILGSYKRELIKRESFINSTLKSYRKQLILLLPEEAYELEFKDILNKVKDLLC